MEHKGEQAPVGPDSAPDSADRYRPGNVAYKGVAPLAVSGDVTLCLNGYELNLNGQCIYVGSGADLTLCDCGDGNSGVITGRLGYEDGFDTSGGGVYVENGGNFTMEGGIISGNSAYFGGVCVMNGSFTMPNSDVTAAVTFRPVPEDSTAGGTLTIAIPDGWVNPYSDVAANAWYYDAVGCASAKGLMGGVGNNAFDPEGSMNRSMVWTVIARLAGQTIGGITWAEDAKAWAVTRGVSDGTDPNGDVTREELVTVLYRYAGSPAMDVPELGFIGNYPDSADVSDWGQDAFAWAISKGFIDGRDGQLAPGAPVTRAEAATILARFHVLSK